MSTLQLRIEFPYMIKSRRERDDWDTEIGGDIGVF